MRVSEITGSNFRVGIQRQKNNQSLFNSKSYLTEPKDTFCFTNTISFKSDNFKPINTSEYKLNAEWAWDEGSVSCHRFADKGLNFYQKSDSELKSIAKDLCLYDDYDIQQFCTVYKGLILRFEKKDLSKASYDKLMPFITKEREKVQQYLNTIKEYDELKLNDGINLADAKDTISLKLFTAVEAKEKNNNSQIPVPNGIFIYGDSEKNKNDLYDWIKDKSDLRSAKVSYNPKDPQASINELVDELNRSKTIFENGGKRTLLELESFDELLTNHNNRENRRLIAQFKNLSENSSDSFYTTLLMKTDKPVEDFESASIANHRFNIQVNLNKKPINAQLEKEYKNARKKLDELKSRGKNAYYKYTTETRLDYDEVNKLDD